MNTVATLAQNDLTPEQSAAIAVGAVMFVLLILLVVLAIQIVICLILYGCLKRVPAPHRKMEPGLVWLLLIPLFNLIWSFFVYIRLPESYQSYFASVGRTDVGDCGRSLGQWVAICFAIGTVGGVIPVVNCFAGIASIAGLVLLIIFLVKMVGFKNQIAMA